ncbi:DUF3192 domain-containing protein [bacterium]|nr:DUF3192 domain-containing protein [bacterium]
MSIIRSLVIFIFLLTSLLIGCEGNQAGNGKEPLTGPGGIRIGMTRPEVVQAMLDEVQLLQMSGQVTNPYATRFVRNIDGESMEVMYYYTGMKKGDDLVTEDELVPIILKDNSVIGWGWEALEGMTGSRPVPR